MLDCSRYDMAMSREPDHERLSPRIAILLLSVAPLVKRTSSGCGVRSTAATCSRAVLNDPLGTASPYSWVRLPALPIPSVSQSRTAVLAAGSIGAVALQSRYAGCRSLYACRGKRMFHELTNRSPDMVRMALYHTVHGFSNKDK